MRLEVFQALLSEPGQDLLARVTAEYDGANGLALATRLRRVHAPDLVAAAIAQVDLRRQAAPKLGDDASRLYLTPDALEQATPRPVAQHRAARLAAAGGGRLVDLGCGIGSDLIAAARAGMAVTGVDRDPVRAAVAGANLAALGLPGSVAQAAAEDVDLTGYDLVFADPARRDGGGRVFDPAAYSPPWSFVERVLAESTACVKTSPALPHRLVPDAVEAEWVSLDGEVKEAALWSGRCATASRRATVLPGGETLTAGGAVAGIGPVDAYLYEPDGAVIRAGLVAELAGLLEAWLLDRKIAYLGAEEARATPFARCFRVLERLPYREKALRAALRERDVGALTIKKRGVEVTPEVLRRRLALKGSTPATIVLTRAGGEALALLVEPVSSPDG